MSESEFLTEAQIEELLVDLRDRQAAIAKSLGTATQDARPVDLDLSIGRLTRVDAMQQQHMASARRRQLQTQLAQVRHAISKILNGGYGECARCGEPIAYGRLRARPEAPFCVQCQGGTDG